MRFLLSLASAALIAAPLAAQPATQAADSAANAARRMMDALLRIPQRAEDLRRAGVPDTAVRGVLDVLRGRRVDAEETEAILVAQREAVEANGPTDNFGAFVQAQLASGKRGRELAEAIRAEHRARGKGRPEGAGGRRPEGAGAGGGRPEGAGKAPDSAATKGKAPQGAGRRPPR
jgi:hypothetical protein